MSYNCDPYTFSKFLFLFIYQYDVNVKLVVNTYKTLDGENYTLKLHQCKSKFGQIIKINSGFKICQHDKVPLGKYSQ